MYLGLIYWMPICFFEQKSKFQRQLENTYYHWTCFFNKTLFITFSWIIFICFLKIIQTEIFQFQIHHSWLQFGLCFLKLKQILYWINSIFLYKVSKTISMILFLKKYFCLFFDFAKIKIWIYKCGSKKLDSNSESKIFI